MVFWRYKIAFLGACVLPRGEDRGQPPSLDELYAGNGGRLGRRRQGAPFGPPLWARGLSRALAAAAHPPSTDAALELARPTAPSTPLPPSCAPRLPTASHRAAANCCQLKN
ncbi:hypothetical protein LSTR_LSTR013333 [Laodelphax striatellus]|uniref:Uncharacterized protein n=1 Tax=Laodelphax striatellus TaxID=195883 RepID=A0A482WIS9_LAOST|nr:hypothetical protein LSTR_LSTR013333 [Laodelphax striatellus]